RDVEQRVALLDHARVEAHEGERAELVVDDLERERARRRVVLDLLSAYLFPVLADDADAAVLAGVGQVVDDGVEHLLHALVLERRAAKHRHERPSDRAFADARLEHLRIELARLDELEERLLVHRERVLEALLPQLWDPLHPFGVFRRRELETVADLVQRDRLPFRVLVVRVPDVADVRDEIGYAAEFVAASERDVAQERGHAETLLDARDALLEVRA